MAHYSEMDFLFNNQVNKNYVNKELNNDSAGNLFNVIKKYNTITTAKICYI